MNNKSYRSEGDEFLRNYFSDLKILVEGIAVIISLLVNGYVLISTCRISRWNRSVCFRRQSLYTLLFVNLTVVNLISAFLMWFSNNVFIISGKWPWLPLSADQLGLCRFMAVFVYLSVISMIINVEATVIIFGFSVVQCVAVSCPLKQIFLLTRRNVKVFLFTCWMAVFVGWLVISVFLLPDSRQTFIHNSVQPTKLHNASIVRNNSLVQCQNCDSCNKIITIFYNNESNSFNFSYDDICSKFDMIGEISSYAFNTCIVVILIFFTLAVLLLITTFFKIKKASQKLLALSLSSSANKQKNRKASFCCENSCSVNHNSFSNDTNKQQKCSVELHDDNNFHNNNYKYSGNKINGCFLKSSTNKNIRSLNIERSFPRDRHDGSPRRLCICYHSSLPNSVAPKIKLDNKTLHIMNAIDDFKCDSNNLDTSTNESKRPYKYKHYYEKNHTFKNNRIENGDNQNAKVKFFRVSSSNHASNKYFCSRNPCTRNDKRAFFTIALLTTVLTIYLLPMIIINLHSDHNDHSTSLFYFVTVTAYAKFIIDPIIFGCRMSAVLHKLSRCLHARKYKS
ncbi:hypothetical protein HELRODRAFT_180415 [Helobdella robusta]|uniref:G-protein coupled receptors family 1 profile domain-containing protein n=1 Tax=Helobdella robusta TaxID=6412 RepID=T1FFW7_HELRO|nr:hypothetical protein HELRODRAFT_180415 [Helobdella robusta]ESN93995.1 hypothetical protein HELRODRAFT_180415 [Helobdella robusta]